MITLSVGSGITDLGDGSYMANMTLEDAGYYKVFVKLGGVDIQAGGYKTYVHPWYLALQKLERHTTSDAELTQRQSKDNPGKTPTNAIRKKTTED